MAFMLLQQHCDRESVMAKKNSVPEDNGAMLLDEEEEIEVPKREVVTIKPLRQQIGVFHIKGTSPFMQLRFSEKSIAKMKETQQEGSQSRSRKKRTARDFDADYRDAMHIATNGKHGIPAAAFRNALISACRTVGFKMTLAKLSIFTIADDIDIHDGTPLVYLEGTPEKSVMPVRNATGVADLRARPIWKEWHMTLRIRFDLDQFSMSDVYNLLVRAGAQVGIGEGRPDSRQSAGLGYGLFDVEEAGVHYATD
jgi:hypothetical protein